MNKILTPFIVKCEVPKDADIMIRTWVFNIYVGEQTCVVKNNGVVHNIDFLLSIKPRLVTLVLPRLLALN
jgi:hypothetical protein